MFQYPGKLFVGFQPQQASATLYLGRIAVILLSALSALAAGHFLTVIPYGRAIWDFVFVLDGAHRVSLGQRPHVDFASPVGSLTLFMTSWAHQLFPSGNIFVGLHVLAWLLMLPPLLVLGNRFQNFWHFLAAFGTLAVVVIAPYTLDATQLSEISYFATYNRFATGLLLLVGFWLVLPKGRHDGLLLGYLLSLLFFLKITTALVALAIIVAACIFGRARLRHLVIAMLSTAFVLVVVQISTALVSAYLGDIRAMASVNSGRLVYALLFTGFRSWAPLAALALTMTIGLASYRYSELKWRGAPMRAVNSVLHDQAFLIDASILVGAALLAESQNTGGLGLVSAAALFFHRDIWQGGRSRALASVLLVATLVVPVVDVLVKRSITSVNPIQMLLPGTRVPQATMAGATLFQRLTTDWLQLSRQVQGQGFFLDYDPTTNAPAAQLAWAISAVEAAKTFETLGYRDTAKRTATLAFSDPFARMLDLVPAHGTTLAMDVGRTQGLMTVEQASHYLSDADGVFVSRCLIGNSEANNEAVFDTVLSNEFEQRPLHRCWDFYQRKSQGE
jgi:hypothetical protein